MTLLWLASWWNLIFIMPFLLALLYLGLYTASGVTFGEPDADVDLDADVDTDIADVDHHVEPGAESALHKALSWLGVGRVPVSLLLMVLMMVWGAAGFILNYLSLQLPALPQGSAIAAISLPAAGVLSLLATRGVTAFIVRFVPLDETYISRRHELLGFVGEAILPIDKELGRVAVRDAHGDLFQLTCRRYGDGPTIDKGTKVKLVAFNGKQNLYYVVPVAQAEANRPAGSSNMGQA